MDKLHLEVEWTVSDRSVMQDVDALSKTSTWRWPHLTFAEGNSINTLSLFSRSSYLSFCFLLLEWVCKTFLDDRRNSLFGFRGKGSSFEGHDQDARI